MHVWVTCFAPARTELPRFGAKRQIIPNMAKARNPDRG